MKLSKRDMQHVLIRAWIVPLVLLAVSWFDARCCAVANFVDNNVLRVDKNTQLDPSIVYKRIEIVASNVTLDGRGAVIEGDVLLPGNMRTGKGIVAKGVENVRIFNVIVKGHETGIELHDCRNVVLEKCDCSDNFHDPNFGWGENGHRGGFVLDECKKVTLKECRANRTWNGCTLLESHDCEISNCDFSRSSNVCLGLLNACGNHVHDNMFQFGIRIQRDEVHARDSACILLDGGSDDNRFLRNVCTGGGDGIFVRSICGVPSTGNYFEENDCSYANNNGFECWSPGNTFIRNRANHCSYGFWMGGSNECELLGNEASYNGLISGNHQSPHLPGNSHAGIVFMFGSSSHITVRGNRCVGNNGAGIAFVGAHGSEGKGFSPYHVLIEGNYLPENRWPVLLGWAEHVVVRKNRWPRCAESRVYTMGENERILELDNSDRDEFSELPLTLPVSIRAPRSARVGEAVALSIASEDPARPIANVRWDVEGEPRPDVDAKEWTFVPTSPGVVDVAAISEVGDSHWIGSDQLYVLSTEPEIGTEGGMEGWNGANEKGLNVAIEKDQETFVAGKMSTRIAVDPYNGKRCRVHFRNPAFNNIKLTASARLQFWIRVRNPNPTGFQEKSPEIVLSDKSGNLLTITPNEELLVRSPDEEEWSEWQWVDVPLGGGEKEKKDWIFRGAPISQVESLSFGFDSWGHEGFDVWLDGLSLVP